MLKDHCRFVSVLSGISVILSLTALLLVIRYCCPDLEQDIRNVLGGENAALFRQAFHVVADGLETGVPVREMTKEAVRVLFG